MDHRLLACLKQIDAVLLEREQPDSFRIFRQDAPWFVDMFGEVEMVSEAELYDRMPFVAFMSEQPPEARREWEGPFEMVDSDGATIYLRMSCFGDGNSQILIDNLSDDPERIPKDMLQKAREGALHFESVQRDFREKEFLLSCIVHDLAGPLTGIQGALGLLNRDGLSEEQCEQIIALALRQCERQGKMISEVVSLFGTQMDKLSRRGQSSKSTVNLSRVVADVTETFRPAFQLAGITLLGPEQKEALTTVGETEKVERIVTNLLENSLRAIPTGSSVWVEIRQCENQGWVSVTDNGPGVSSDVQRSLFTGVLGRGNKLSGKLGLGLYFCRLTVESWGGHIAYSDRDGGGAIFKFSLPLSESEPEG